MAETKPWDVLWDQAEAAELGALLRVHRERASGCASVLAIAAAVVLAGIILLTGGIGDWRAAVTIVVVVWWLAVVWWQWAPLNHPRVYYAVAEHGLVISTLQDSHAARWSEVSYQPGDFIVTLTRPAEADPAESDSAEPDSAEPAEEFTQRLPALSGSGDLQKLLKQQDRLPLPAPRTRWLWRGGVAVVTVAVVWFAMVPLAADVVLGRRPTTVADLTSICTDPGSGFGRGAAYQGNGPHPLVVLATDSGDESDPSVPYSAPDGSLTSASPADSVQLVGCLTVLGHDGEPALQTCPYQGGSTVTLYQGQYQLTVYDVRTGDAVASVKIPGEQQANCDLFIATQPGRPQNTTQDTDADDNVYPSALSDLVNGPARK